MEEKLHSKRISSLYWESEEVSSRPNLDSNNIIIILTKPTLPSRAAETNGKRVGNGIMKNNPWAILPREYRVWTTIWVWFIHPCPTADYSPSYAEYPNNWAIFTCSWLTRLSLQSLSPHQAQNEWAQFETQVLGHQPTSEFCLFPNAIVGIYTERPGGHNTGTSTHKLPSEVYSVPVPLTRCRSRILHPSRLLNIIGVVMSIS